MRKILCLLGVALMIFSSTAAMAAGKADAGSPTVDAGPKVLTLKNGLKVLVNKDDRFPLVNVRLYVHAGSAYETPKIAGISHLLEHMVFKGTAKRKPGQTAHDIESVGGSLNAATSFDYTMYYVEVPDDKWKLGLDVVTDMAFNATIDPSELKSERKVVLQELDRGEDNPTSKLFKTIQKMVWKDSTYEWPIIGFRETVSSLTSKDIKDYIAKFYQPQSMLLVVTGKVDEDAVVAEAERLLGGLKNTRDITPPAMIPVPTVGDGPKVVTIPGKWNKVYLGAAFPIPNLRSGEIAGLELLAQLMCGDDTSRLYRKFKYEKRLVDSISMAPLSLERGGFMYIFASLDEDKVDTFWKELVAELAAFDPKKFTDKELDRGKLNLEDGLFLTKETLSGTASKLGHFYFFEDGLQSERNYLFALQNADQAELSALYNKYIRPDRMSAVVLTPEKSALKAKALTKIVKTGWNGKAATAATATKKASKTTEIKLPGGSKLVLIPDTTLPYTAMSMAWSGGDTLTAKAKQGLAAISAATLTRGTKNMTATAMEDFLADHAASMGASAGRTTFSFDAKFPTRFSKELLPLIKDVLTAPAWASAELDRSKQDQIAAIKRREDKPLGLLFRHLFTFLFDNAPFNYLHQGQPAEIAKFTGDDVSKFWTRQSRRPFVLSFCGDFDAARLEAFAKDLARELKSRKPTGIIPSPEWKARNDKTLTLPDRNQAHLLMVFPVPGKSDLEASAELSVLKSALSGQSGLLFRDLRDKHGLAYTVTGMVWQATDSGLMALYIGTSPDKVDKSLEGFKRVLKLIRTEDLPGDEVSRARNIVVGDYYQDHQSLLSRSREAASLMARGFDRDYQRRLIERARKVKAGELKDLAAKYLDPDKAYLIKVLP